jgi:protein ATS1
MYHYVSIIPGSGRNGDENCSVYGWGRARQGQLGVKTEAYYPRPTTIKDIPFKPEKVVCGQNFTYLVGDPATGEHLVLGIDKHGIQSKKPERVKGWKDIGATWNAIFVLFQDGTLTAWGKSDLWDLIPPDLPKIEQIAVGSDHVLALTVDNKLLAWGWAVHGNCGETASLKLPLAKGYVKGQYNEIGFEGEIVKIAAGYSTSFVVTRERQQLEPDYEMTESKEKHHDEN